MRWYLGLVACVVGCAHGTSSPRLALRRVVLHQNGNGYFERAGRVEGGHLTLRLSPNEVNDTLATLTVFEEGDDRNRLVVSAEVPHPPREGAAAEESVALDLHMPGTEARTLRVAYAVPTPTWQMTYRVILPEREGRPALLQVWAMLHNASQEDWRDVQMTLATGAPLSFASNLRAPLYSARPDVTGRMIAPVSTGPVVAERASAGDADGDGIADASDRCPSDPEDRDAFEDDDGCPDADNDHDRVVDAQDRCPNDPETYNGTDDDDGCPDRGWVALEENEIRVLQSVGFAPGSSAVGPASMPVVDAVAATMRGNPQLRRVEMQGHAAGDERDAWDLALARAAAVRALLIARGVDASRVVARSFGATQPLDPHDNAAGRARNRRVSFRVVDAGVDGDRRPVGVHAAFARESTGAAAATASEPLAHAEEFMGATQYVVTAPVTLTAGSAALVTVASVDTPGDDVYLFRPDAATPGSAEHPYRAAFLRNRTGLTLVAGQAAVFAHGTFVGQGLLERLDEGQSTWIPYALDASATVTATRETTRERVRVVSAVRDAVLLEDASVEATRYVVTTGAQGLSRAFLKWERRSGYAARELPRRPCRCPARRWSRCR